eukprot:gnl/TRDRNA2_/TRDRNA2_169621_c0_seq1.p1 gnl/TRDRNA2_/TRDRNA2_169621_c0~~gnl/TRDRNA2_/TRDRNA2_169621_c0_seq1.p1  ORF type:complete len:414 (+),score=90.94 gnl/TRDRNA2_/TRDRNA2_169621_c0_seq1:88-1329(+)
MGCGKSAEAREAEPPKPTAIRKRLSAAFVEPPPDDGAEDCTSPESEEDRGLISSLSQKNVIEMVKSLSNPVDDGASENGSNAGDGGGAPAMTKQFSIGSETDKWTTSFANKKMKQIGDKINPGSYGMGCVCRKGLKPESPNQDSWSVLMVAGEFSMYGVYDGHGDKGHDVSNFVKENLPKLFLRDQRFRQGTDDMAAMIKEQYKKVQSMVKTMDKLKKIKAQEAGTTATVVVHDHAKKSITVSHVGDCTAVLGSYKDADKKELVATQLTRDHKPDLPDERARIESVGGRVVFDGYYNHRVYAPSGNYPGLNMSRCLGDLRAHADAGCSCEPEVTERALVPEDHILLVCSDGVWEFITPQDAVNLVSAFDSSKAKDAAEKLAKKAWDLWMEKEGGEVVDDITVILVYLQAPVPA